jgi:hypothetical protein
MQDELSFTQVERGSIDPCTNPDGMFQSCYAKNPLSEDATMRKVFLLCSMIGLLNVGSAVACEIVDKQEIQVGVREGVAGKCPNNELTVQCVNEGEDANRFTCTGPEGSFDGPNLQSLISMACGCGADRDEGATEQLQQELGD